MEFTHLYMPWLCEKIVANHHNFGHPIQGSFTFKKSIWPICVPDEERPREHHFLNGYKLVGFGRDINDSEQCSEFVCLKSDQLNVKPIAYCNATYEQIINAPVDPYHDIVKTALPNNFADDPLICAKVSGQTSGTCEGDSGGILWTPVFKADEGEIAVQQAVVRGSIRNCDGTRFPSIFNRLDNKKVVQWLKSNVFGKFHHKQPIRIFFTISLRRTLNFCQESMNHFCM